MLNLLSTVSNEIVHFYSLFYFYFESLKISILVNGGIICLTLCQQYSKIL